MGIFFKRFFATILGFLAAVIIFLAGVAVVLYFVTMAFTPSERVLKSGTILEVDLAQDVVDSPRPISLSQILAISKNQSEPITLFNVLKALETAAEDPNITAISINMSGRSNISLANGEELRDALLHFKSSCKKPVYAFGESASQLEYYVASVADHITIAPLGAIEWQGVAINMMFYTPLMERLGVKTEVFRPESCIYKSAIEPFSRSNMSSESREQSERLVASFWNGIVKDVAASRNIAESVVKNLAYEQILLEANFALYSKFIDEVAYYDTYEEKLAKLSSSSNSSSSSSLSKENRISLSEYSKLWNGKVESKSGGLLSSTKSIALIYADGAIVDGNSDFSDNSVGSSTLIEQLRRVRHNKDIDAVVVRVNSPGGSALAADIIWREMSLLQAQKPLIVSMGAYAASGGYYISVPADIIVADRFSLTGSIGVYGIMFDTEEAMRNKLHINQQGVMSSPSADFGRVSRPITALERAAVMRGVNEVYNTFINCVAEGRKLSPAIVKALAGGRVWTGAEAASCNLIDNNGGLRAALALAVDRSGADSGNFEIIEIKSEESNQWLSLLYNMNSSAFISVIGNLLPQFAVTQSAISTMNELKVIQESKQGVISLAPERVNF